MNAKWFATKTMNCAVVLNMAITCNHERLAFTLEKNVRD